MKRARPLQVKPSKMYLATPAENGGSRSLLHIGII